MVDGRALIFNSKLVQSDEKCRRDFDFGIMATLPSCFILNMTSYSLSIVEALY